KGQEQVEHVLARRPAADVPPQEGRDALEHALPHRLEAGLAGRAEAAHGAEEPRAEAERVGVLARRVAVLARPDPRADGVGAQIVDEPVELDLARLDARTLLQQHVPALYEAQAPTIGLARPVEGVACREQSTGHVLRLVPDVRDEMRHDESQVYGSRAALP